MNIPMCAVCRMEPASELDRCMACRIAELEAEVERLRAWQREAKQAIRAAMEDMEWDCIPASECGETWAYVAEFHRLLDTPLAEAGEVQA